MRTIKIISKHKSIVQYTLFFMAGMMLWIFGDMEQWPFLMLALILLISGIAVEMFMEEPNISHLWTPPSEESVTEHLLMVLMMGGDTTDIHDFRVCNTWIYGT